VVFQGVGLLHAIKSLRFLAKPWLSHGNFPTSPNTRASLRAFSFFFSFSRLEWMHSISRGTRVCLCLLLVHDVKHLTFNLRFFFFSISGANQRNSYDSVVPLYLMSFPLSLTHPFFTPHPFAEKICTRDRQKTGRRIFQPLVPFLSPIPSHARNASHASEWLKVSTSAHPKAR